MNTVVFEHVKVTELPEATTEPTAAPRNTTDPAFGIWKDYDATTDVDGYVRTLRAPRYRRDGTRNDD